MVLHVLLIFGGITATGSQFVEVVRAAEEVRTFGFAQSNRGFEERVEHRLQIKGRTADDLEHIGGSGLLLKRFAQLVEQPRVLNGNKCLVGEIPDELDLLLGERTNLLPINDDSPD